MALDINALEQMNSERDYYGLPDLTWDEISEILIQLRRLEYLQQLLKTNLEAIADPALRVALKEALE